MGGGPLRREELVSALQRAMPLDTWCAPSNLISICAESHLIRDVCGTVSLAPSGRKLAKAQGSCSPGLSRDAKDFLVRSVFLCTDSGPLCCGEFVSAFSVDLQRQTFSLARPADSSCLHDYWVKCLSAIGLLIVETSKILIVDRYLDSVNQLLRELRSESPATLPDVGNKRIQVGDLAEDLAVTYEKERLERNGYPELTPLVGRVSAVDNSAGYDIRSFRGAGPLPEKEIYIEVKGTALQVVDFVWTRNERFVATKTGRDYWLYLFSHVDLKRKTARGPLRIRDPIHRLEKMGFRMEPVDVRVWTTCR